MKYRAEIDGLRALAVLPVILFHAGIDWLSGGYLGVDIFFVISGYLITTIIIQELQQGRFSLVGFYNRRVRRIFPALAFVILACLPMAWLWLPADALQDFSLSLVGVATFSSNIVFWQQSSYFDTASDLKPLLHTWSLAVEEQYYLIFPFVVMVLWRYGKRVLCYLSVVAFIASLGLAHWASVHAVSANFFLLPTRGWELLLGSFCAYYLLWSSNQSGYTRLGSFGANCLSMLGIALIVFAICYFDQATPTPSLFTLVPTLGAALIILFARADTLAGRILSLKPLVMIGLISYSAYLWHQPLFVFYRYNSLAEPSLLMVLVLSVAALAMGWLSWRFVETPFRRQGSVSIKAIYSLAAAFCVLLIGLGLLGYKNGGFPERASMRLPENLEWASLGDKIQKQGEVCSMELMAGTEYVLGCEFGDVNADDVLVLYGDSHAQSIHSALDDALKARGVRGLKLDVYQCENIPYVIQNRKVVFKNCAERYEEFLSFVDGLSADVVLVNRWTFQLYPLDGYEVTMPYKNSLGNVEHEQYREYAVYHNSEFFDDAETKAQFLDLFIRKLAKVSDKLYLIDPIPEVAVHTLRANILHRNRTGEVLQDIAVPYSDYKARHEFVLSVFDDIAVSNITRIHPAYIFCDSFIKDKCVAQYEGVPFYLDDDHLSDQGAQLIVEKILNSP